MLKQSADWDYRWGQIVGRAWADEEFNRRLLADPLAVCAEYHLVVPAGVRIEVLENPSAIPEDTDEVVHLVVPGKPSDAELCEEDLGGTGDNTTYARCGCGGCHGCRGCGGCGGCGACYACIWCY